MSGSTGVVIAGAAETDQIGRLPGHSTLQLHVEGALKAVADPGLSLRDIDGIATVFFVESLAVIGTVSAGYPVLAAR